MKTVIEMAREAGGIGRYFGDGKSGIVFHTIQELERFSAIVREDERERLYQAIRNAETPATQLTLGQQNMIKEVIK